jgi:glycosyltransferase involved in cell wall biosynthesis
MKENPEISIMIHDLNPWGGQDRSMLEIAWQLNREFPLEIHSFSLEGYDNWRDMKWVRYEAPLKKPIILKYLSYQWKSWNHLKAKKSSMIQSTGTASLRSDVVQVQFIHHTWQKIAEKLPPDKLQSPSFLKNGYHSLLNLYKKKMETQIYHPDKKYVAISHGIKKELMHHFQIPSENIEIIYHGVDTDHFLPWNQSYDASQKRKEFREKLALADEDFTLLHVGALNARKGIFKTLDTLAFLKDNGFENIKLLAVGQGDSRKIKKSMATLGIEDKVILAPHTKDIRNYYWAADCFFFPTYYEPFGLVILEAMACGLPVVVSDSAGASELIQEGENGILIDPYDKEKAIANGLIPLLRDPSLGSRLGRAARQTAEQHNWETVGNQYRQFYRSLMSPP